MFQQRQGLRAIRIYQEHVLDVEPSLVGRIEGQFKAHYHAFLQNLVGRPQKRWFFGLIVQSNGMAYMPARVVGEAMVPDRLDSRLKDIADSNAGTQHLARHLKTGGQGVMDLALFNGALSHANMSATIAPIAVHSRAAIQLYHVPGLHDLSVARSDMGEEKAPLKSVQGRIAAHGVSQRRLECALNVCQPLSFVECIKCRAGADVKKAGCLAQF